MRSFRVVASMLVIAGALMGIYSCFLNADNESGTQMLLFTLALLFGAWILKSPRRKIHNLLIIFLLPQLFAIKTNSVDYVFGLGISMIQYFRMLTLKPDHLFLSTSYANLSLGHQEDASLLGINLMALAFLITLLYLRKKQNSFQ